jgi:hypothetical protein
MFVNVTAWAADPTLSMSSFIIEPGGTYTATIDLVKGDIPVLAYQANIVLPEGLEVDGRPKAVAETLEEDETPSATYANGKLVVYNNLGLPFKSDATATVKITFKAAESFAGGTIKLEEITISGEGNVKITPANVSVDVTVPVKVEYPSLAMDNFDIVAGQTAEVMLKLNHNADKRILAFQCDIVLPEGLEVDGRPKAVAETLDEEETPSATYSNGKIVVYNNLGLFFNLNKSEIVKFKFKAAETFASGKIKFENVVISAEGNEKIEPKGFEVLVNPTIGISGIKANTTTEAYTLSGTRVRNNNLQRGLYIVNGKKVVVK